ncbi:MAG: LegC family aminotransferase [Desulfovibrio sp.]
MYKDIIDFIREMYQQPEAFIPLHAPVFKGNEKKYLEECVDSTFVSSVGAFVTRFEEDMAAFTGAKYAIATSSGTTALHLALEVAGATYGKEVITQALSFVATANAISHTGARPVFIDSDMETFGMCPVALRTFLEEKTEQSPEGLRNKASGKIIAACVPVHIAGHALKIEEVVAICDEFGLPVVEDAAEGLGTTYKGKHTGTFGLMGALSFNGNKTITTGGGGMLLTNDPEIAARTKHLSTTAKVADGFEFAHDAIAWNYRMPNLNAALGVAQMEKIQPILEVKRTIAGKYRELFAGSDIQFVDEPAECHSNFWLVTILMKDRAAREDFLKETNGASVMTRPFWKLLCQLPMYTDCQCEDIPNAFDIYDRGINLPSGVPEHQSL